MKKLAQDVINNLDTYQYERPELLEVNQPVVHFGLKRLVTTYKKILEHPKIDKKEHTIFLKINRTIQKVENGYNLCR